jgi:hypothetical protein
LACFSLHIARKTEDFEQGQAAVSSGTCSTLQGQERVGDGDERDGEMS